MIKLTQLINELGINNPRITLEIIAKYYETNIINRDVFSMRGSQAWKDLVQFINQTCDKYGLGNFHNYVRGYIRTNIVLKPHELNEIYNEMRQLVQKHVGEEILNELEINNPNITVEKALEAWNKYCNATWTKGHKLYALNSHELLFKYGFKYSNDFEGEESHVERWLKKLKQSDLNKFYKDCINMLNK